MKGIEELVRSISKLQRADLEEWISESLVVPDGQSGKVGFSDMECARIELICTLKYELEIDQGTLPLVMSLVDQLYDARGKLKALASAVIAQPPEVQQAIMAAVNRSQGANE